MKNKPKNVIFEIQKKDLCGRVDSGRKRRRQPQEATKCTSNLQAGVPERFTYIT